MTAVAAFDIGTNSVLCLVATLSGGEVTPRSDHCIITRLGEGVDVAGALAPAAVDRTLAALRELSSQATRAGVERRAAVGTSALRDARDAAAFVSEARAILGCPVEVISGAREAALTFAGSCVGLRLEGERTILDVGGGSTELVRGERAPRAATSIDIGSVRLTERFMRSSPPSAAEIAALRAHTVRAIENARDLLLPTIVGVAGTITTLAMVEAGERSYSRERVHGRTMTTAAVRGLADRLSAMTVEERALLPGMPAGRALPIAAGAQIVAAVLEAAGASRVIVSDGGVRYGLAEELLAK